MREVQIHTLILQIIVVDLVHQLLSLFVRQVRIFVLQTELPVALIVQILVCPDDVLSHLKHRHFRSQRGQTKPHPSGR